MTALEPEVSENGRYSITEASKALAIHRSTLDLYLKHKTIPFGIRKSNKRRFILGSDIKKFWKKEA